jgi:hypothetical protein
LLHFHDVCACCMPISMLHFLSYPITLSQKTEKNFRIF